MHKCPVFTYKNLNIFACISQNSEPDGTEFECLYLWFCHFDQRTIFTIQKIRKCTPRKGKNVDRYKGCLKTQFIVVGH